MQTLRRLLPRLLLAVTGLMFVLAVASWVLLNKSLPALDGSILVNGLNTSVTIERDDAGIPVITAANRQDLAYATGFVHAQDRFFQMDLTRRKAAGELAEIFGGAAVGLDKRNRFHRFRTRAAETLRQLSPHERGVLSAYSKGVNDGLDNLGARPFEYWLLRESPRAWTEVDSILVIHAMYIELNDERATRDVRRGLVRQVLPQSVFEWLYPQGTEWDAPLMGAARQNVAIPDAETFTISGSTSTTAPLAANADAVIPGSNNWAIAGALTPTGRALVANDMHLSITVPNVFYRARLRVVGGDARDLTGVTLPGVPLLVAGSNSHIAWGNTNSYGDWSDAVIVRTGQSADSYITPVGERRFKTYREQIRVKGSDAIELTVRETVWGPVLDDESDPERILAVSWIAHYPEATNISPLALETVTNTEDALQLAGNFGMPPQNFVVGDAQGNIGWTIAGKIPRRSDYDAFLPADWSESAGWIGWLHPGDYPRILNPASGRIWTANARVVDGNFLGLIGDGGYDLGARASQIRDGLFAKQSFEPGDMLSVQLDDRATFLSRWRDLLLHTLDEEAVRENALRAEYRALADNWIPRASTDSVGYRLVRGFRLEVRNRVFGMLMQPVRQRYGEDIPLRISNQFEAPLWALLSEKPGHLLSSDYTNWDDLLLQAVDANIDYLKGNYSGDLSLRSWGERNTAAVRHPLSRALPFLSAWLNMPAEPLHGDSNLPRAQGPSFGASERFGVSPGDEANGYLHMPVGQSGHPLSEFYGNGHDDWVHGRFSSFLPGEARHTLILEPVP